MTQADMLLLARYGIIAPSRHKDDNVVVQSPRDLDAEERRDLIEFAEFMLKERSAQRC